MKAYASLHLEDPGTYLSHEVDYEGYERVEVDFENSFCAKPITINFAIPQEDKPGDVKFVCLSSEKTGIGQTHLAIGMLPHLKIAKGLPYLRLVITNMPAELPANLNPIARIAWMLVLSGEMKAESLHPVLYEAINAVLFSAGLPVIPVVRQGTATMVGKIGMMPSLSQMTEPAGNA